jgi:hypothetical protein
LRARNARGVWIEVRAKKRALRAPRLGLASAHFNGRTVRITDSARERHGLFRCGAFGAACVAVHRSSLREWYPPRPEWSSNIPLPYRFHPVLSFLWANLHCLTVCRPFATYRRATPSTAFTIGRCIAAALAASVCACVSVAPAQHSGSFTGRKAAPEFILRGGEYTRRAHDAGGMHGRNLTSALMRSRVPNRTRDRGGKPIQLGDSSHEHGPRSGA